MNKRQIEQVSGAIITSFVNLHFLEEAKQTGLFRQRTKHNLKRTIDDLLQIENNYFNKIEAADKDNLGDKLVANKLEFIEFLLNKFTFNDFSKMQEISMAYALDKEAITKVSDEILLKNGAEL